MICSLIRNLAPSLWMAIFTSGRLSKTCARFVIVRLSKQHFGACLFLYRSRIKFEDISDDLDWLALFVCVYFLGQLIKCSLSFYLSCCPPSCLTARRTCAWHMGRTGLCTLWALRLMCPSWTLGSPPTASSLSAPGSEEAVSMRPLPCSYKDPCL